MRQEKEKVNDLVPENKSGGGSLNSKNSKPVKSNLAVIAIAIALAVITYLILK